MVLGPAESRELPWNCPRKYDTHAVIKLLKPRRMSRMLSSPANLPYQTLCLPLIMSRALRVPSREASWLTGKRYRSLTSIATARLPYLHLEPKSVAGPGPGISLKAHSQDFRTWL